MAEGIHILVDKKSPYLEWTEVMRQNLEGYIAKKSRVKAEIKIINGEPGALKSGKLLVVLDEAILANQKSLKSLQEYAEKNTFSVLEPMTINHDIPTFLSLNRKYEFYMYDAVEDTMLRTGHAKPGRLGAEYWAKLFDLSNSLYSGSEEGRSANAKIFIADTGIDLMVQRDNLIRDLKESGAEIFPKTPLPGDPVKKEEAIKQILNEVNYSVHLFGASFDEFEAMKGHNSIASKIAEDRSKGKNPLSRFVWIPLGLKLSEEKKLAYESLKRDYEALHGAELIQAPLETLKTLIYNEIGRNNAAFDKGSESYEDCVYVINDVASNEDAGKVEKELNALGIKTVRSAFDQDDMDILSRHKRILRECSGCILYYPGNNKMWIKSTMDDIVKSPGYGRKKAYQSIGLISPKDIKGMNQRFDNYSHIDINKKLNSDSLGTFIKRLS